MFLEQISRVHCLPGNGLASRDSSEGSNSSALQGACGRGGNTDNSQASIAVSSELDGSKSRRLRKHHTAQDDPPARSISILRAEGEPVSQEKLWGREEEEQDFQTAGGLSTKESTSLRLVDVISSLRFHVPVCILISSSRTPYRIRLTLMT